LKNGFRNGSGQFISNIIAHAHYCDGFFPQWCAVVGAPGRGQLAALAQDIVGELLPLMELLIPARSTAEIWTNTSFPPSVG
jgi:hypothetical protein